MKALSFACVPDIVFQTQHPAGVGTLEREERYSDTQMGLSPCSLKLV